MFIFKDISSEEMDIAIEKLPSISSSDENIQTTPVEGMDGEYTEILGYKNDSKSIECYYLGSEVNLILNWLRGSGDLTIGNEIDVYRKARVKGKIEFEEMIKNELYKFNVIFDCKPFRYLREGKKSLEITNNVVLNNFGNKEALPLLEIEGSGDITVVINGRTFNITGLDDTIKISSDIEQVFNGKGKKMQGKFPYLDVGKNTINWTGNVTKFLITPNWRLI